MSEHQETADELERELADMEHRAEKLEDEISETREEWERKQRDHRVPGAIGDPATADQAATDTEERSADEDVEDPGGEEDPDPAEDDEPDAQADDEDEPRSESAGNAE